MQSEVYSVVHNVSIDDFLEHDLCNFFKDPLNSVCVGFINAYGAAIIDALKNNSSPDAACRSTKLCTDDQCNVATKNFTLAFTQPEQTPVQAVGAFDPFAELLKILETFNNNHTADVDFDKDTYSEYQAQARGWNWKGRDCNDLDKTIHPGRYVDPKEDQGLDYTCNGISGRNESNNVPWRTQLCANTSAQGFAVIGDSVGAHFELPPTWFNGSAWNSTTFDDFVPRALDEFDLPEYSGWSSYYNQTPWNLPAHSIYQYLFERNQCNFKDYQNCGVNGADSFNTQDYINVTFARNQTEDLPAFVILELVGNDVCAGGSGMTTVSQFSSNIQILLNYLDSVLPPGSKVLSIGLVDGRVLYNNMWNRTHPIGVTYEDVYDYLTCLQINPCDGWLNSNETTRNNTSAQAAALNQVYAQIKSSGQTWKNFEWDWFEFPAPEIIANYTAAGGNAADLIEPVDGFHPSQIFHSLMADFFWGELLSEHSDWLGPVNPNNALITELFGDQGGYGFEETQKFSS